MYRKWFVFDKSGTYKCFLDVKTLPKLNTENDEVINYLIDAASYWIKEFGIDGYRLDHAIGPSTKFWSEFVSECLKLDNRLMFMPEIWLTGIKTEHLDTLWFLKNEEKLRERLRAILFKNQGKNWDIIGDSDAEEFAMSALNNIFKTPLDFSQNFKLRRQYSEDKIDYSTEHFAFADNHDMQRISWILKNDRNRIDNSIRKVRKFKNSVVYYGTEIYLSQKKDFGKLSTFQDTECRRFMDWGSVNDTVINRFAGILNGQ
jgi:glycosidase